MNGSNGSLKEKEKKHGTPAGIRSEMKILISYGFKTTNVLFLRCEEALLGF